MRDIFKLIVYPEIYMALTNQQHEEFPQHIKEMIYMDYYECCTEAAQQGIYEAYYYLGVMNYKGLYTKPNNKKAFYYFCKGASYSHALSFYELYNMYYILLIFI